VFSIPLDLSSIFPITILVMCLACLAGMAMAMFKKSRDKSAGHVVLASGDQEWKHSKILNRTDLRVTRAWDMYRATESFLANLLLCTLVSQPCRQNTSYYYYSLRFFSNSLLIHHDKTKIVTTVKEVWIPGFYDFTPCVNSLVFVSNEKIYQALETAFVV